MDITVRNATADDYSPLCELSDEMDALHRGRLPHIFQQPNGPARERDYYRGLIADESVALLVAEVGGEVAGFVHTILREAPAFPVFVPRRYAVVDEIVVKSGFQNQGIGSRLMDEMQAWAVAKGASSVELNVYEFNQAAIAFYESLGYQTLSRKMSKELTKGTGAVVSPS